MLINEFTETYMDIDHHKDMMYELKDWSEIKETMGYPVEDNNKGLAYGVYWLDDNDNVVEAEWYATNEERFAEVNKVNEQLKEEEMHGYKSAGLLKDSYKKKLLKKRDECKEILEKNGLFVENCSDQVGLSISLTRFGLSTIYATLTQEELEYIVDNEVEL